MHEEEGGRTAQKIQRLFRLGLQRNSRTESRYGGVKAANSTWQEAGETTAKKVRTIDYVEVQRGDRKVAQK